MNDLESLVNSFKKKKNGNKKELNNKKNIKNNYISKILISIIIFLISLIYINGGKENLVNFKKYVFTNSLEFTKIKNKYESLFGDVIPKSNKEKTVFAGKLMYTDIETYLDGEKLKVASNSLISNIKSGIVVFIGEKEGYGNTVIVQGIDGYDIWYGNLDNISVSLYDYLESETVMGEVKDDYLYLVIKKDNNFIKYEDYKA